MTTQPGFCPSCGADVEARRTPTGIRCVQCGALVLPLPYPKDDPRGSGYVRTLADPGWRTAPTYPTLDTLS